MAMLKRFLMTGLLVWIPIALTVWVLDLIVSTMDRSLLLLPPQWRPEQWLGFSVPGFGMVVTVAVVLVTGVLAANIIGQRLMRWWDSLLERIPIVSTIYKSVKQVSDTLLAQDGNSFRRAVLVEFPSRGQWTVGFVVGTPAPRLSSSLPPDSLAVYVPTAPNPTSGYTLIVPPSEVRDVDMSVDEALQFVISMGVVAPGHAPLPPPAAGG
jgi:uncharacterized membrane protein